MVNNFKEDETVQVGYIKPEDVPEALEFLKNNMFQDEPITSCLNRLGKTDFTEWSSSLCTPTSDCSLKLTAPTGEIVGVSMNRVITKEDPGFLNAVNTQCPRTEPFLHYINIYKDLDKRAALFKRYPSDKMFQVCLVSIHPDYRRRGLINKFGQLWREYMNENNLEYLQILCTSEFTAKYCMKQRFDLVCSLEYKDYKVNGVSPFLPEEPHVAARVFVNKYD